MTPNTMFKFPWLGGDTKMAWPQAGFPTEAMSDWLRTQQEALAAAMQFGQEMLLSAHKEIEAGGGIMQRMMTAKTPEDFFACQRDMVELVSSTCFEQSLKLTERMQTLFAKAAPAAAEATEPMSVVPRKVA